MYMTASDPNVLSKMSRAQVEALRSDIGMEATNQLLNRWDGLQKPGKLAEARMDQDDFNEVADRLGLKPYAPHKNEKNKRALGTLKFRIEQLIDIEQDTTKRVMTRQEKMELMRKEMAREVLVNPGIFSRNFETPAILLNREKLNDVVVPKDKRAEISEGLRKMLDEYPGNPQFLQTEENIKRWYMKSVMPSWEQINE